MERRLYRSRENRILLGVCGGLGEYFNIDPVIVRVIAVLLLIPGVFPAVIAYFVLALVIPLKGTNASNPRDSFRENISDVRDTTNNLGEEVRTTFGNKENRDQPIDTPPAGTLSHKSSSDSSRTLYILGVVIVTIGAFILLVNLFDWFWRYFWPVLLIIAGAMVIVLVTRRRK
jgi:phage shock protein C